MSEPTVADGLDMDTQVRDQESDGGDPQRLLKPGQLRMLTGKWVKDEDWTIVPLAVFTYAMNDTIFKHFNTIAHSFIVIVDPSFYVLDERHCLYYFDGESLFAKAGDLVMHSRLVSDIYDHD